jgi:hypothetical protein
LRYLSPLKKLTRVISTKVSCKWLALLEKSAINYITILNIKSRKSQDILKSEKE